MFQIHQKLTKQLPLTCQGGAKIAACKFNDKIFSGYYQSNGPHFGTFCIRPNSSWNTDMYSNQQKDDGDQRAILMYVKPWHPELAIVGI